MKEFYEKHKTIIFSASILICILVIIIYRSNEDIVRIEEQSSPPQNLQNREQPEEEVKEENVSIMVDVKGAVLKPGVYLADKDERVNDLIQKAGGFTEKADHVQVNLSQHVKDEMVIYVPLKGEMGNYSNSNIGDQQNDLINLNSASESELETLPGIGPSKALSIIEFRESNGGFKSIQDLKKISGIGEKTFEKLESLICVN